MREITSIDLHTQLQQQEIYLLDVRESLEHEDFNIGGEWIPLGDLISQAASIPKDKPVIVYCKKGIRSQIAIQRLEEKFGFTNLVNLKGGMDAWKKSIGR
ncbi:MAG: rhodanese-like domain-containing protein [Bacteroidota bacterium]